MNHLGRSTLDRFFEEGGAALLNNSMRNMTWAA